MYTNHLFDLLLCACCGYALWKGGAPERISAAIFFIAVVLTFYAGADGAIRWTSVDIGIFIVDVAALLAWGFVAIHAQRFWPLWFTAMHGIAVAGHAVKMADPELMRWGYAFAIAFWSYPMLFLLAAGTWCHRRRLARHGSDPDWSSAVAPRGRRRGRPAAAG